MRKIMITLLLLISVVVGGVLNGLSDFDLENRSQTEIVFSSGSNQLSGTLIWPESKENVPVVLLVHGDGEQDRYADSGYLPIINTLLDEGIAVFTWDKPGVGKSSGNWLSQSMSDRAAEATAAFQALSVKPELLEHKIGFLGFSQAGWVIPEAARLSQPAFSVLVGAALNWRHQGNYFMTRRLQAESVSEEEIAHQIIMADKRNEELFSHPESVHPSQYQGMNKERFLFAARNFLSDASDDLKRMPGPVLAIWGSEDKNVNPEWNAKQYQTLLLTDGAKEVLILPNATHGLLDSGMFDYQLTSQWPEWKKVAYLVQGRHAYASKALYTISDWIKAQTSS